MISLREIRSLIRSFIEVTSIIGSQLPKVNMANALISAILLNIRG